MIRVLIGDDHPIVRAGIRRIIENEPDMTVVGEAVDADGLLALAQSVPADVASLDISMAGPEFTEVLRRFKRMTPPLRAIVLSVFPEEQFAPRALRAGAMGYLSKDQSPEQLVTALRRVNAGHRYVSPRLAEWLASRLEQEAFAMPADALSAREYQVLRLIGSGLTVKQTGERLSLSPKTVSTYRSRILEKLGLRSTSDVVRFAVEQGLTRD
jgi:two-component system invasion response regulator UvrY